MLAAYETLTLDLIQAPSSPVPLIGTPILDQYINTARQQVAADGECIRFPAALVTAVQDNPFSSIVTGGAGTGIGQVIAIRSARIGGNMPLYICSWEWFSAYYLGDGAIGLPVRASQQGQGVFGTFFLHPFPAGTVQVGIDAVCLPDPLLTDADPEAIPALWTDAVPFYAAWLALMSLQRNAAAQMMMTRYRDLIRRGRQLSTPSQLPENLPGGMGTRDAAMHDVLGEAAPTGGAAR